MALDDSDLVKMQFDYAWKWFDFHARQRTTMFNFTIILRDSFLPQSRRFLKQTTIKCYWLPSLSHV